MKRIRLFILAAGLLIGVGALLPTPAFAETSQQVVCGTLNPSGGGKCTDPPGSVSISSVLSTIINLLSWAVGAVAVIMIIVGGFKYVTASGDSNKITSARSTITYALVGLVIAALAQTLVKFVLEKL